MALAQEAAKGATPGESFTKPDISSAIPPEQKDAVDRVVAAGMKMMYSPGMRDDLKAAVNSPDPTPKVLAENVVGLLLTMDKQAGQSGIPGEALMPAAVELVGDAGEMLVEAGRPVTQEDYKTAVQMAFVLISKKMGMDDGQIMDTANKALPPDQQVAGGAPPDGPAAEAPPVDPAAPTVPTAPPAGMPPAGVPPQPVA